MDVQQCFKFRQGEGGRFRFLAGTILTALLLAVPGSLAAHSALPINLATTSQLPPLVAAVPWTPGMRPQPLLLTGEIQVSNAAHGQNVHEPKRLGKFYGWPSYVSGAGGNVDQATTAFLSYDLVVLGSGLEEPPHPDHQRTRQVIRNLTQEGRQVFGYVGLGKTEAARDDMRLFLAALQWRDMDATGLFLDEAGYDFGITRAAQNSMVSLAQGLGLNVMISAFVPADALGELDERGQPDPPRLGPGDWYLVESWLVGLGELRDVEQWAMRARHATTLARERGVQVATLSTTAVSGVQVEDATTLPFLLAYWGSRMWSVDAFAWTDGHQGASDNRLVLVPWANDDVGRVHVTDVEVKGEQAVAGTDAGVIWIDRRAGGGFVRW